MTATLESGTTKLVVDQCWCGIWFAMPSTLSRLLSEQGKTVYCPLGHGMVRHETENAKLAKEIEQQKRRAERAESNQRQAELEREWAQNSLRTTRGVVTKLKKRAAGGVCPCCNRHFTALERHMAVKHPEFAKEGT